MADRDLCQDRLEILRQKDILGSVLSTQQGAHQSG
jgi:hypothetical protein